MDEYQKRYEQTQKTQLELWKKLILDLVGDYRPDTIIFRTTEQIVNVLDKIGKSKASNHTFMPSGGGLDVEGCSNASEEGLIDINMGIAHIVKPNSLTINLVSDNPEWWYLRLNCAHFPASGVYEELEDETITEEDSYKSKIDRELEGLAKYYGEELVEVSPGEYIDRSHWDESFLDYDEDGNRTPLPEEARLVNRMQNGGDFVIFSKFSLYNRTSSTYDGRHNLMDEEQFYEHIIDAENHTREII